MKDSVPESLKTRGAMVSLRDCLRRIVPEDDVLSTMNHKPQIEQIQ